MAMLGGQGVICSPARKHHPRDHQSTSELTGVPGSGEKNWQTIEP